MAWNREGDRQASRASSSSVCGCSGWSCSAWKTRVRRWEVPSKREALGRGVAFTDTPLCLAGKEYSSGLGTHAESEIRVHLPTAGRRLTGRCGVQDSPLAREKTKALVFSVEIAGREVWRSGAQKAESPPAQMDVALAGARQFVLRVRGPIKFAHADWVDLQVRLANGKTVEVDKPVPDVGFSFRYRGRPSTAFFQEWRVHSRRRPATKGYILKHNARSIERLLVLIEQTVHQIRPDLPLGLMTCDHFYEGYDFDGRVRALAGPKRVPVLWRPGGGFYTDENPNGLADKAHAIGRQIAFLPRSVVNIQSFWSNPCACLAPTRSSARILARRVERIGDLADFACMGSFENRLGGRLVVAGYAPWTYLQSLAKATQMKRVCRWLSRDTIPAYVASYHRINLWARDLGRGRIAVVLINASMDPARAPVLAVRTGTRAARICDMQCATRTVPAALADGPYRHFKLPTIPPWNLVLVTA